MSDLKKSASRIWTVSSKELLDFVRDWRTLVALVLVPLLIFPIFFIALPLFLQGEMAELDQYELELEIQIANNESLPVYLIEPFNSSQLNYSIVNLDNDLENLSDNQIDGER